MQRRCDQNRKRSKRRAIYCPIHECYLHSVSRKQLLFAPGSQPQTKPYDSCEYQQNILMLLATETTVLLEDEWLEAFWCNQCQETKWYHVKRGDVKDAQIRGKRIVYEVSVALQSHWQQSVSAISPEKVSLWRVYPEVSNQLLTR